MMTTPNCGTGTMVQRLAATKWLAWHAPDAMTRWSCQQILDSKAVKPPTTEAV